jgi:hypothetical protein
MVVLTIDNQHADLLGASGRIATPERGTDQRGGEGECEENPIHDKPFKVFVKAGEIGIVWEKEPRATGYVEQAARGPQSV